ncbi:MAG: FAD-dependent oxidoreductase [Methanobacteriota archaeon]|nr:MAG: FAD-dependent oxidoreductase [Euryarchaeota archaeon]
MVSYQQGKIINREIFGNLLVLTIEPEKEFEWEPGQFIVTQNEINGNIETADYTIVSSPKITERFQIIVEVYTESVVGAWLKDLGIGQKIRFKGPKGRTVMQSNDQSIVIVYREIGGVIALAFLRQLNEEGFKHQVTTIGFNNEGFVDLVEMYRDEFSNLSLDTRIFVLDQTTDEGKFPRSQLKGIFEPYKEREFYIAGMSEFVKNLRSRLISWGVPKEKIHREFFGWKRNHPKRRGSLV